MINLILWIVFGALAGWLASLVMRTDSEQGALGNIVVGILGAMLGGFISNALGGPSVSGFNVTSVVIATVGAIILLFFVGLFRRGATRH